MNPNRELYGRITLNGEKKSLGRAPSLNELLRRVAVEYTNHKYQGEKLVGIIELSYEKLPAEATIMSREDQLAHELMTHTKSYEEAKNDVMENGLTWARMCEIMEHPEWDYYVRLCQPANRIGIADSEIERIRGVMQAAFDDDYKLVRNWIDQ